jgi:hypothetical protein
MIPIFSDAPKPKDSLAQQQSEFEKKQEVKQEIKSLSIQVFKRLADEGISTEMICRRL